MKIKGLVAFIFIVVGCFFCSCSKDDDDGGFSKKDNQENLVEIKVFSNAPNVPINLEGVGGGYLTIHDYWETHYTTKEWGVGFVGRCDDKTVLITGEIYVNGNLVERIEANSILKMHYKIK